MEVLFDVVRGSQLTSERRVPRADRAHTYTQTSGHGSGQLTRGGFRHVQHVRPNRVPMKWAPTRGPANFCNIATCRK